LKRVWLISNLFIAPVILASSLSFAQKMPIAYYRAEAAFNQNDFHNALIWIDSCLLLKPIRYEFYLLKGASLLNLDSSKQALDAFYKANKIRNNIASYYIAKTYCRLNDSSKCLEWIKINLNSIYREPESKYILDNDFSILTNKEWKETWEKDWYSSLEKDINHAEYLINSKEYEKAIDLLNQRIRSKKSNSKLFLLRGTAHLKLRNINLALKDLEIAQKRRKKDYSLIALRAKAYLLIDEYEKADKLIDQAISYSGGKPEFYLIKSEILSAKKEWENAYLNVKKYLDFYPNNPIANNLKIDCASEAGYYSEALLSLAKLLKLNPQNPELYFKRGKIYYKAEQYREAILDFDKAIQLNYKVSESYLLKGKSLMNLGERKEACKCFSISGNLGSLESKSIFLNSCIY